MTDNVHIRRARLPDVQPIVDLWMEMMRDHERFEPHVNLAPAAPDAYHQYTSHHILQSSSIVYVAEKRGRIIGYCLAYRTKNLPMFLPEYYGYLSDICIKEGEQNQGIGSALLKRVTDWFRQSGLKNVQLQVYHRNKAGTEFWKKAGYDDFVHGLWLDI